MKKLTSLLLAALMSVWAWGAATEKTDKVAMKGFGDITTTGYQNVTVEGKTDDGVGLVAYAFIGSSGQIRGNKTAVAGASVTTTDNNKNWSLYNTEAFAGALKEIIVSGSGTLQNTLYVALGTSSQGDITNVTGDDIVAGVLSGSTFTFTIDESKGYTYFKLLSNQKFCNGAVTAVEVNFTYVEDDGGETPADPAATFTGNFDFGTQDVKDGTFTETRNIYVTTTDADGLTTNIRSTDATFSLNNTYVDHGNVTDKQFQLTATSETVGTHTGAIEVYYYDTEYNEVVIGSQEVTLTIINSNSSAPQLTVSPAAITFDSKKITDEVATDSKTVVLTTANLAEIDYDVTYDAEYNGDFKVTVTGVAEEGGNVTIAYEAIAGGTYSGKVVFTGLDAEANEASATLTFSVMLTETVHVSSVTVTPAEVELAVGKTEQLTAVVLPTDAENQEIEWSSEDETIATVSETGLVTAVAEGMVMINAKAKDNGKEGSCIVTVVPAPAKKTYTKVTAELADWSGEYLIVDETASVNKETKSIVLDGSLTTIDVAPNYQIVTISSNSIDMEDGYYFTIEAVEGGYSVQSASGLYIGKNDTKNGLSTAATYTAAYLNKISMTDGAVTIEGATAGRILSYNSSSGRFRYFGTGTVALYKLAEPEITVTPASLSESVVLKDGKAEGTLGKVVVTGALLSGNIAATITDDANEVFSISEGASLDAAGGNVVVAYSATTAGTYTATLHLVSGDVTKDVTLSLEVTSNPDGVITTDIDTNDFGTVELSEGTAAGEVTIKVTGANLTQDIAVTITEGIFSVADATVAKDADEAELKVTYSTTVAGTYEATLTLTSKDANEKDVKAEVTLKVVVTEPKVYTTYTKLEIPDGKVLSEATIVLANDTKGAEGTWNNGFTSVDITKSGDDVKVEEGTLVELTLTRTATGTYNLLNGEDKIGINSTNAQLTKNGTNAEWNIVNDKDNVGYYYLQNAYTDNARILSVNGNYVRGYNNSKTYPYVYIYVKGEATFIDPTVAVTGVTLNEETLSLEVGEAATLVATVAPDNATDKTVTWESSDDAIATVVDGVVTAVAAGMATITAIAGEKSATCTVTITEPQYTITFLDYDGETVLATIDVKEGVVPVYPNADPTRAADEDYTYEFAGWTPDIVAVTGEATYTATYTATAIVKMVKVYFVPDDNWKADEAQTAVWAYPTAGEGVWTGFMSLGADGRTYEVEVEESRTNLNFVRFPKDTETPTWGSQWNQTRDMVFDAAKPVAALTGWDGEYADAAWYVEPVYIKFVNGETLLSTVAIEKGETPAYTGETPTKAADEENTYTFAAWSPEIVAATADVTYTATFTATPVEKVTVYLVPNENWKEASAKFAVYTYGGSVGEQFSDIMDYDNEARAYKTTLKAGFAALIYVRLNSTAEVFEDWSNKWNQTDNLTTFTSEKPVYILPEGAWDGENGDNWHTNPYYYVRFINWDGTELQAATIVDEGETPVYLGVAPTKAEDETYTYTFSGWEDQNGDLLGSVYEDKEYTAQFTAEEIATMLEAIGADLEQNGAMYNVLGQKVDATYKGVVIQNGKKYILR